MKGSFSWFHELEDFCERYEWSIIPREDVIIERTHHLLMSQSAIEKLLKKFRYLSRVDKQEKLTEHLISRLENEIYGKYYSYPPDVQKSLTGYYETYFGKREWKGSIFELYDQFLREQHLKGSMVPFPGTELDLYDLAALAYLYKRIKETEVIQEASHVVIDEAQDFGMMVYGALKYCLSKCTYTIMGDVSQNIYFDYGLTDWEELRGLMLPDPFDYFGLLRKSYRNTVEISQFAMNILQHGRFPIYPIEPIIRHGNEVQTKECRNEEQLIVKAVDTIQKWQAQGYETIAVICRDDDEATRASEKLHTKIQLRDFRAETEEFGSGVMVLPIEYSKGLEFDAVLLFNANTLNYPSEDGFAKLLYVAATRALHELVVLYCGQLTELIAVPVSEEQKQKFLVVQSAPVVSKMPEEEPKTKKEVELDRAMKGKREMELRNQIGPKRIIIHKADPEKTAANTSARKTIGRKVDYYRTVGKIAAEQSTEKRNRPVDSQQMKSVSEFGEMPGSTSLRPLGHPNLSMSVRWVSQSKQFVEITSAYGILRITPIANNTIRVSFARDPIHGLAELPTEIDGTQNLKWNCREAKDAIEIRTEKVLVRIDRRLGHVAFYNQSNRLLLSESSKLPRQVGNVPKNQTWTYFDWTKKEILKARGITDDIWLDLTNAARYISHGAKSNRPACIMSNQGYQLFIPAEKRVMCCTIPTYGPYLYIEDEKQIDYFFRSAL